jgi:hypothetical protein
LTGQNYSRYFANGILALFSVFFLFALYLIWQRNAITPLQYFAPLSFLLFSIVLLSIVSIGWKDSLKIRLIVMITGCAFGFLVVEGLLSLSKTTDSHSPKVFRQKAANKLGISFDMRSKFEIVTSLQNQNINAWPNISSDYFLETNGLPSKEKNIFPMGGMSNVIVYLCNESGEFASYHSDEYGFNNPKQLYQPNIDILALGDSYVHGACVAEGNDIVSFLRNKGSKALNLANSGMGPLMELATLSEYGPMLKPKKVLWFYSESSDIADLKNEMKSSLLLSYLNDNHTQALIDKQPMIDQLLASFYITNKDNMAAAYDLQPSKTTLKSILKLQKLRSRLMLNQPKAPNNSFPGALFESVITTAQHRVQSWGGEFIFVYLPSYNRFQTKNINEYDKHIYKNEVMAIMDKHQIKTIDVSKLFSNTDDPIGLFQLRLLGHYTPSAYEMIADNIMAGLST